ncbi:MAG: endonuclease V [Pseudochelatococcus sp.]|jgi:deoxyribonuclease V|uniref:endonuclease V n=1 Tax=Pseudochelatococcus sp. TaxID=2020869 RepID=UPI003D8B5594
MDVRRLHAWNLTPREAIALQKELRAQLVETPLDVAAVRLVAGVDVSVKDGLSRAAVVVCALPDFSVVEVARATVPTPFPYVPGLLTFREGPALVEAFARLRAEPDVFLFDGIGIAHPRRIGIAAHMGLLLDRPGIGCGKTRLCGFHDEPDAGKGAWTWLYDHVRDPAASPRRRAGGERPVEAIGAVVRTRAGVSPMFISPGHRADIPTAVAMTLRCTTRYRLPEPIRLAHKTAALPET